MSRSLMIAVIVAACAVVAALLVLGARQTGEEAQVTGLAEVRAELAELQTSGAEVGDPDAPVRITEFVDLACPACRVASQSTVPALLEGPVAEGKVRLRVSPMAFIHPQTSERGSLGLLAAARQDAGYAFAAAVYANQGRETEDWLDEGLMEKIVVGLGLDLSRWRADFAGEGVIAGHQAAIDRAASAGVSQTPTFLVEGPGGSQTVVGVSSVEQIGEAIAAVSG